MYCTCVHIYALYIHVSQQELDTCCIVATGKIGKKKKRKTTARTEKNQECACDQFQQNGVSNFQSRAGREKGNTANDSPRKQEEVKEREEVTVTLILNLLCPTQKSKNTQKDPSPTHHSRTLHLHHSIKHIKKYTVLSHIAK